MGGFGLGELFDLSTGLSPGDLALGANTGKRLNMAGVDSVAVVIIKAAGTGGQDPTFTLRQHTAASGGVSSDLAIVDRWWHKTEATLDGDEVWTEVTQAASASVVDTGNAASEQIVVLNVRASQLTPGNRYISVDIPDPGLAAQVGAVLYILQPSDRGGPASLSAPLR